MWLKQLRQQLLTVKYDFTSVTTRLGDLALSALARNNTVPADSLLATATDPQATLIRFWLLHKPVTATALSQALGDSLEQLEQRNLVMKISLASQERNQSTQNAGKLAGLKDGFEAAESNSDIGYLASVEIRPYATDSKKHYWICADLIPGLDNEINAVAQDFVLGASPASATLSQMADQQPKNKVLDLGTGCGVQTLLLADFAEEIIATDVNPRALALAEITAGLSQVDVDFRKGSLYEPVKGEKFDQIISNPPYVMAPPKLSNLTYRESGFHADDLVKKVILGAKEYLNIGGTMQVLANWAITQNESWQDRVCAWITEANCDALVVMREQLDIAEYIEIWLADAGLSGAEYCQIYRDWLAYFEETGITAVGMGWFSLRRVPTPPVITCEILPEPVIGPIAKALTNYHLGVEMTRDLAQLWDAKLVLRDRVRQESIGFPGMPNPEGISFKQYYGLARKIEVDTGLAAVLGACDGELTLRQILISVAEILELDLTQWAAEILPVLGKLVRQDWFANIDDLVLL